MAYSENIAQRVRDALKHLDHVEEKKMFGGLAFMVNGKMCLAVGATEVMYRIAPQLHEQEVKKAGCSTVVMGGKRYRGYVDVREENLKTEADLKYWINLALDFNEQLTKDKK
ncbi:MAG: hypothetical protein CSA94_00210 [Bacteroidetes bacterium]|nr:MAG: hypothetical protein CSA94_00210 [Bacteroidota bacterium]